MAGPVFPWRDGNQFELLIDGPAFFPRMLLAIMRAEFQVDLELYLVEAGACAEAVVDALEKFPAEVARYRSGEEKIFGWLMGQVMRETRGKGNPALLRELLEAALRR